MPTTTDIGPQRIKVVEAVRALKTALKCAICQGTFRPNPITTNCDHTFCQECFSSWMLKSTDRKCPVCLTAVQRRSCKPSPEVADYVNRYLLLAKVFQETLKTFNVPPEHEFFESQVPFISESFVPPSPAAPVFLAPLNVSRNPRRKLESKAPINSTDEVSLFDAIFSTASDPSPGPSTKRRKMTVGKAKKEPTPSGEQQSSSMALPSGPSSERTPPSVVAAVASLVQEAVHKEVEFASPHSQKLKTSRLRARSLKTPKKSTAAPTDQIEQLGSPLRTPDDENQQQQQKEVVVEKSQTSVTKSRSRSKSTTPQTTDTASTSDQQTVNSGQQQTAVNSDESRRSEKPAATRRSSRNKSSTPPKSSHTPTSERKTPTDNQQSQEDNKSASKKRKVYWDWVPVADTEPMQPAQPDIEVAQSSETVRSLRGSARLTSVRLSSDEADDDRKPPPNVAQVLSTQETEQQHASAATKQRRSSTNQAPDANAQEDGGMPQSDAAVALATDKRTEEERSAASKKRRQPAKKRRKDESNQEGLGEIGQLDAAQSLTETVDDQQTFASSRKRISRSTARQLSLSGAAQQATEAQAATVVDARKSTADPVKSVVDEQCQTEAKVINDACVQTMAESETVVKSVNRVADEEKSAAVKEKRVVEMMTKEAQTDAYPVGFDDASFDDDWSDEQFDRDSRAIMNDAYLSDRVDIRRRLWRMTRANVHRLMATYPGASRVALLFRVLPCFSDIINTRETLQQLVAVAQGNIDAHSQALERSMINLDLENMPLFEEQPAAANNDSSMLHALDKDGIKEAQDGNSEDTVPESPDVSLAVEEVEPKTAGGDRQDVARNDENIRRSGSPLPPPRLTPIIASPLTPSRRPLESNDANISNKDNKSVTELLKKGDSNDEVEGELLSTQPPSTMSPTQQEDVAEETRHSPDMFSSQTSLDVKERMEDDDQSIRSTHPLSVASVEEKSKRSVDDDQRSSRAQSVDSTSVIGETPSTLLNVTSQSIRSKTASGSQIGLEDTEDGEETAVDRTKTVLSSNATVVSDVVGETPTQQLQLDAHCNSLPADDDASEKETPVDDVKSNMVILVSKPRQNDIPLLSQFEQLTGGKVVKRWEDDVTHLVMMDAETRQITQRTIKYAVGIAAKVFVINRMWIEDSVIQGKALDPISYEIIGDSVAITYAAEKSRLSTMKLFEGYSFYLPPRFYGEISAGTVERILRMSGATVVKMEADLPPDGIILFGTGTAKIESKGYAEFADNARRYEHAFKNEVLAADFVLDGISDYKIPDDHQQYRVYKGVFEDLPTSVVIV